MRHLCIPMLAVIVSSLPGCASDKQNQSGAGSVDSVTPAEGSVVESYASMAIDPPSLNSRAMTGPGETGMGSSGAASSGGPRLTYTAVQISEPYIALTFDDGPHETLTPKLLDILKARNVKATFFVLGQCVANHPEVAKRIVAEGHEIANHSWSHPLFTRMSDASVRSQLERTQEIVEKVTGAGMLCMRPPYGGVSSRQKQWIHEEFGYLTILWAVDPQDWKNRNAALVTERLLAGASAGAILLTHDIHASTIEAMPGTIDALLAQGYRFTTVSRLIQMEQAQIPVVESTPAPHLTADASR